MILLIGLAGLLLLGFLPQWWVKKVFSAYGDDRGDFPGTGGQLVEHLIETLKIEQARVDVHQTQNHFDPDTRTIALTPLYHQGKSLTAITVAAHELGHLIQQEQGNILLKLRTGLVRLTQKIDRFGMVVLILMPFAGLLTRSPALMLLMTGFGLSGMLVNVLVHLVTLPMELDASFGKALPLLVKGEYITREDEPKARRILWAAALTYLASALSSLVNLGYWLRVLRR